MVDASVALKWRLNDEEYVEQALALRDDSAQRGVLLLLAPTLIIYELANGLVMALRRGRLVGLGVEESLQAFIDLELELRTPDWRRTCQLALIYGLSAYDSAYLDLAEDEACELWTGDKSLYDAVRDALDWVRWIGDHPI